MNCSRGQNPSLKIFLMAIASILIPFSVMGTAFLKPQGDSALIAYYLCYKTDHFWNASGKRCKSYNRFVRNAVPMRLEYGLAKTCTLAAESSYNVIEESINGKGQGFDDVEISLKHFLKCKKGHLFSGEARVIIPTSDRKAEFRYGRLGAQISLLYSKMFTVKKACCWYDTKIGFRFYEGIPSNQIRAEAGLGACLSSRLTLYTEALLEYGINSKECQAENIIRYSPYYRLFTCKGELYWRLFQRTYLSAGGFWNVWGRCAGTGGGFYAGGRVLY